MKAVERYDKAEVDLAEIKEFLRAFLYEGPMIGKDDEELILENLDSEEQFLSKEAFLAALLKARNEYFGRRPDTFKPVEFRSNREMREKKVLQYNPRDKFLNPIIASQEIGWDVGRSQFEELDAKASKKFPKLSTPETRFANAYAAASEFLG